MDQFYSKQFEQVSDAGAVLEQDEVEYPLEDLVAKSGLSKKEVIQLLKKHWIEADNLDIVYLDLTKEEEALLYPSQPSGNT